jgi:subtilisin-like proprotein convertase family protein
MKKNLLLVVFIFSASFSFSQNAVWKLWDSNKTISSEKIRETDYSENQKLLQFNAVNFKQSLAGVPQRASGQAGVEIQLPNIKGALEKFLVWESSNFDPALQAQFPEIRAFVGKGITDPSAVLNFSFDQRGIQTMIFRAGVGTEFIEPYTKDWSVYVVFDSQTRYKGKLPFVCSTEDLAVSEKLSNDLENVTQASNEVYKTMRLALSCTAEYTTYHGGTVPLALAAMNATMARCNGVFERDLAIKLLIIANNNVIIYTNAASDPYSTVTGGTAPAAWNSQLQTTLNNVIGAANYDIGHLFGATGGGGSAGCIGCVCVDATKGSAITSPIDGVPMGDAYDIDYVAHEMGHQMGANHTFTHTGENNAVNVEPGSGSTIMAYAGIGGGGTDMQNNSDDYFTFRSISQIQTNMNPKTCPVSTSLTVTNPKPVISVLGPAFSIPISTAFKLTGSGTGTAGEVLTYCWEQNDDASTVGGTSTFPSPTKTNGPNFRSRLPSLSPVRFMPQFSDVLNGNVTTTWETTSSVARNLSFAFTVRDNVLGGGQTNTLATSVAVVNTGAAFAITNPNTQDVSWNLGSSQTVTWNVAGTTANGINTANVNILLSTDGGATFPIILAANTANDGTEVITLPSTPSATCRIMIEAVGNIFYAVSKNIALGFTITNACNTYNFTTPIPFVDQAPGSFTTRTLDVPITGTISDINVFNNITHSYMSDVQTDISSPQNPTTFVKLFNRSCGQTNGTLNLKFSDGAAAINCAGGNTQQTVAPGASLSDFNGQNPQGTWTFRVYDNFAEDTGTINSWGIEVCTQTIALTTSENQLSDFAIYPNPNKGNFNIQFDNTTSNEIKVNVYDMRGRTIFENNYSNQVTFNENIQLTNAQAGVYLVSVTDGNQKMVKRIVIE